MPVFCSECVKKVFSGRIEPDTVFCTDQEKVYLAFAEENSVTLNQIRTIVIGNNKGWKQEADMGKITNQNFVNISYKEMIKSLPGLK